MQHDGETGSGSDDTILKKPVLATLAAVGLIVLLGSLGEATTIGPGRVTTDTFNTTGTTISFNDNLTLNDNNLTGVDLAEVGQLDGGGNTIQVTDDTNLNGNDVENSPSVRKTSQIVIYKDGSNVNAIHSNGTRLFQDASFATVLNSSMKSVDSVFIEDGTYTMDKNITIDSGTILDGNRPLIKVPAKMRRFRAPNSLQNTTIRNLRFKGTHGDLAPNHKKEPRFIDIQGSDANHLTFENLWFDDTLAHNIYINAENGTNIYARNIYAEDSQSVIRIRPPSEELNSYSDIIIKDIRQVQGEYSSELFNVASAHVVGLMGYDNAIVEDIFSSKQADGPNVQLWWGEDATVENVVTYQQHDVSVTIDGGKNIRAIDPQHWGAVYITPGSALVQSPGIDYVKNVNISNVHWDFRRDPAQATVKKVIKMETTADTRIENVDISNIYFNNSEEDGIAISATNGTISDVTVRNAEIENTGWACIRTESSDDSTIRNIRIFESQFRNCGLPSKPNDKRVGILFDYGDVKDVTVADNRFVNESGMLYGIRALADSGVDASSLVDDVKARDNQFTNVTKYAEFGDNVEEVTVQAEAMNFTDANEVNIHNGIQMNTNAISSVDKTNYASTNEPTCDSSIEGDVRYNGSHHVGCDGSSWNKLY